MKNISPVESEKKPAKSESGSAAKASKDVPKPWPKSPHQQFFIGETSGVSSSESPSQAGASSTETPGQVGPKRMLRPHRRMENKETEESPSQKKEESEESDSLQLMKVKGLPPQWDGDPDHWESFQQACRDWHMNQPMKPENMSINEKRTLK